MNNQVVTLIIAVVAICAAVVLITSEANNELYLKGLETQKEISKDKATSFSNRLDCSRR